MIHTSADTYRVTTCWLMKMRGKEWGNHPSGLLDAVKGIYTCFLPALPPPGFFPPVPRHPRRNRAGGGERSFGNPICTKSPGKYRYQGTLQTGVDTWDFCPTPPCTGTFLRSEGHGRKAGSRKTRLVKRPCNPEGVSPGPTCIPLL